MSRVLIEFYSEKTPENLVSILNEQFAAVFFLYSSESAAPSSRKKAALSALVKKLMNFPAEFREIGPLCIENALDALNALWKKENEYLIDITGGSEAFIAAAGIFCQQGERNTTLHQYDVRTGKKLFSYPADASYEEYFPHYVSVPDLLTLNGSVPLSAPSYVFTRGPLKAEILRLWNAVKSRPKDWNRFCALSGGGDSKGRSITQKVLSPGGDASAYQSISARLKSIGALREEKKRSSKGRDCVEFMLDVPEEAKFLYDKAGNVLEMYCALCAHESGLFHDIRVGVMTDWDGTVSGGGTADPYNEVDLILMRENLPILVSCKNTVPKNDYLYEIMIMAKHYGGYYATPALFTSGRATESLRKRASEMGIVLIDSIRHTSQQEMIRLLQAKFGSDQKSKTQKGL